MQQQVARMETLLKSLPLPSKKISVNGSNVSVTISVECMGEKTAKLWAAYIAKFSTVSAVVPVMRENKDSKGGWGSSKNHKAWLVNATI